MEKSFDVVIIGAGLAGLTLARHLLMHTDRTVLLLEKREEIPPKRQKVGESSVQLAGYYFSKVLDLESHLIHDHFLKYNLRFYWKSRGKENDVYEDYSASYIRSLSNVASYQLNRNVLEGELLRRNLEDADRFTFVAGIKELAVELAQGDADHRTSFKAGETKVDVRSRWLVDTSGRGRFLARREELTRKSPVSHASFFWWVEGLVDVEKLSRLSNKERRLHPRRRITGHMPSWLATNHFVDEGMWFWVIPLQGKTSLGLVFDRAVLDHHEVFTVERATEYISKKFPLLRADLEKRKVLDFSGLKDYAHDCVQTIYPERWAFVGEAGRFHDPLYSPGSDLIALHNTLIVDAILTEDPAELAQKVQSYESLVRAAYQAYLPSYSLTYDCLGDQEAFTLKYAWELTIYFAFYVFPFINDLFPDRRFILAFLRSFSRLGPINRGVQNLLSGFFQWKKSQGLIGAGAPIFLDFMEMTTLQKAEKTFYEVGVSVDEAKRVLGGQLENLEELARFIAAHVAAVVLDEPRVQHSQAFVAALKLDQLSFDPKGWAEAWQAVAHDPERRNWQLDPTVLDRFRVDMMVWKKEGMIWKEAMMMPHKSPPLEAPVPGVKEMKEMKEEGVEEVVAA